MFRYLPTMVQYCYYKLPNKHHNKKILSVNNTTTLHHTLFCRDISLFRFEPNSSSANGFRNDITYEFKINR